MKTHTEGASTSARLHTCTRVRCVMHPPHDHPDMAARGSTTTVKRCEDLVHENQSILTAHVHCCRLPLHDESSLGLAPVCPAAVPHRRHPRQLPRLEPFPVSPGLADEGVTHFVARRHCCPCASKQAHTHLVATASVTMTSSCVRVLLVYRVSPHVCPWWPTR